MPAIQIQSDNKSGGNDMMKQLFRCTMGVLILLMLLIAPASADLTAFDASVEDDAIVVTGVTSENETVEIISMLVTDVNVKHGEYEYEIEEIPIPEVNGDETLTFSAKNVSDMTISLKVRSNSIWNTTIVADGGVASYTTPTANNSINFILDKLGIGGTVLEKPAKVVMSYAAKLVDGSPVDLNIKIKGTSEDKKVSIEQAVHRTISADGYFSIEYDSKGLPAGTYVISATTDNSSETVTLKLKSTKDTGKEEKKEVTEGDSGGGARAYYRLKAAREEMNKENVEEKEDEVKEPKTEEPEHVEDNLGMKSTKGVIDENVSETEFKTTEPSSTFKAFSDFIRAIMDFFASLRG